MKLLWPVLATVAVVLWSPTTAFEAASLHLRVSQDKDSSCTITNESQCDGQNWTGSTCCADSSYECRWDDYGQNVKRCQKIGGSGGGGGGSNNACTITNESQCDGQNWTGSTCCADSSYECRWDDYGQNVKRCQKINGGGSSESGSSESGSSGSGNNACTIANGAQCDGDDWTGSTCCADSSYECRWDDHGSDFKLCQKIGGDCTIAIGEQCGGDDWTGDRCCADSNYECRWDDYGEDLKRCQKKAVKDDSTSVSVSDSASYFSDSDSYSAESESDSYSESDSDSYFSDSELDSGSSPIYISDSDSGSSTSCDGCGMTWVDDWADCTDANTFCKVETSWCIYHSQYYAQCKPETLPSGELCGQSDGTNEWLYDYCPSGETCEQQGTDFRCTKTTSQHHKMSTYTYVDDWGNCLAPNTKCKGSSQCVKYSPYYAQCKPATLPQGELCGQNDGTNVWKYDHCPTGQICKQNGNDFRCTSKTTSKSEKMSSYTYVDDWAACTPPNFKCKGSSVCVKYSQYYSQCKPATLPQGELCGQNDGTNVWKYDHCPAGQTCKQNGSDFRCS